MLIQSKLHTTGGLTGKIRVQSKFINFFIVSVIYHEVYLYCIVKKNCCFTYNIKYMQDRCVQLTQYFWVPTALYLTSFVCSVINIFSCRWIYHVILKVCILHLFQGLKILAFPCNQFMSQEPGTSEEIKCFISGYKGDGKFDVFSKVNVNGEDAHPLWKYLKEKQGGLLIE